MEIPASIITDQFAFSYADHGWNLFREIAASLEKQPGLALRDSNFFRFFKDERVRSVQNLNDVLFMHDPEKRAESGAHEFYLGTQPWGEWTKRDAATGGVPWGHHYDRVEGAKTRDLFGYRNNPWYQPGDEHPLELEWEHLQELSRSLSRGYRPGLYGTYPEVVLLVRQDGERRAVVSQGQHRMAILTQMGHQSLTMVMTRDSIGTVHEDDVEHWSFVRNKRCTPEQALLIFHAFFDLDGRERADFLGLPTSY